VCVRYLYIVAGPPTLSGQEFSYSEIGKKEIKLNSRENLITTNKLNMQKGNGGGWNKGQAKRVRGKPVRWKARVPARTGGVLP
jgi:hypothetical protein